MRIVRWDALAHLSGGVVAHISGPVGRTSINDVQEKTRNVRAKLALWQTARHLPDAEPTTPHQLDETHRQLDDSPGQPGASPRHPGKLPLRPGEEPPPKPVTPRVLPCAHAAVGEPRSTYEALPSSGEASPEVAIPRGGSPEGVEGGPRWTPERTEEAEFAPR
eukprot:4092056-Pyramimonas_sp.AAC.3